VSEVLVLIVPVCEVVFPPLLLIVLVLMIFVIVLTLTSFPPSSG
jgi:hypothetical protein